MTPSYTMLSYIVLYYPMLYRLTLCYVISSYTMLSYIVLYYVKLYRIMICVYRSMLSLHHVFAALYWTLDTRKDAFEKQ